MNLSLLKHAVFGFSAILIVANISCGKKSGGGSTTATAPQDCSGTDCTAGNQYASGVYVRTATGQGAINYNKSMTLTLHLFGKDAKGFNGDQFTQYNGEVVATGSSKIHSGSYYGVTHLPSRAVSGLQIGIDFNFGIGYGGGYYDAGYNYGYSSGYTYNPPATCAYGCQPQQPNYSCQIPLGDYSISTLETGDLTTLNSTQSRLRNLKIRLRDADTDVEATVSDAYIYSYNGSSSTACLRGRLVVERVNGQNCNTTINLNY